jgi:prevent-host-death family protein
MLIAVHALKSNLSRILAQAQAGEVIEVTSHKKPIARIVGIPARVDEGLNGLISNGTLSWRGGKPKLAPPVVIDASGPSVSQIILDDRR